MWTGPVILTLVIAGFALALSVISLGWQVHSWRLSGPRVTVKRTQGIGGTARGVWFTGVQAVNSGRLGTQPGSYQSSFSHDAARLVFCAHNAAVREIPNDHTHRGVFVRGEAFEALKPGEVLEVFWVGHGGPARRRQARARRR
jgi:hypothetical protein